MKVNNTLLGVVGAAAIGAALGILFAPKKGSETRKDILNGSKDLAGTAKESLDEALTEASSKYAELKKDGKDLIAKGKESLDTVLHEVSEKFMSAKKEGKEMVAEGAEEVIEETVEVNRKVQNA